VSLVLFAVLAVLLILYFRFIVRETQTII